MQTTRVLPSSVASTETSMLETVLQYGTGRAAAIGQFAAGKTGTTSNYGDAWFVGWDSKYTVAVWVGYPNKLIPMTTDFNGEPVLGGTFPALIWHDFMTAALRDRQDARRRSREPPSGLGQGLGHEHERIRRRGRRRRLRQAPSGTGASSAAPGGAESTAPRRNWLGPGRREQRHRQPGRRRLLLGGGSERAAPAPSAPASPAPQSSPTPSATPGGRPIITRGSDRRQLADRRRLALRLTREAPNAPRRPATLPARRAPAPHRGRQRPRDVRVPGHAEAPGQLDGAG